MIRIVLISVGFVTITLALILIQPTAGLRDRGGPDTDIDVTRADISPEPFASAPIETTVTQPDRAVTPTVEATAQPAAQPTPIVVATPAAPTPSAPSVRVDDALETLIVSALQQGQSDAYIDALVNNAAQQGTVTVPGELVTQDGRVDTQSLLSALSVTAPPAEGPTAGFYVVKPGDSLNAIAYRFYGRTSDAEKIYRANRTVLDANPVLVVGLRLNMPPR